jgi:hypothetical protein
MPPRTADFVGLPFNKFGTRVAITTAAAVFAG